MGSSANILELRDVSVSYGLVRGLQGVTLEVPKGRCVAVVGPNGAGKSSLVRVVSGLLSPASGTIAFHGRDVGKVSVEKRVRQGLAVVPEGRGVVPRLSVDDNLLLGAFVHAAKARSNADRAYDQFPLRKLRAGSLSGGQLQVLAIARALCSDPTLVVLDEPSMGLAPVVIRQVEQALHVLREGNASVLVVEQNAGLAFEVADDIYVLELGEIVRQGHADELSQDDMVRRSYLGL